MKSEILPEELKLVAGLHCCRSKKHFDDWSLEKKEKLLRRAPLHIYSKRSTFFSKTTNLNWIATLLRPGLLRSKPSRGS
jgi:hypothetical protein